MRIEYWDNIENRGYVLGCEQGKGSKKAIDFQYHGLRHLQRATVTLPYEEVQEIQRLYATGEHTQRALAKQFNTSESTVNRYVNNKSRTKG